MIRLYEKTVGVWYLSLDPGKLDLMLTVNEVEPDKQYQVDYRFRLYNSKRLFDSDDTIHWYHFTGTGTKEKTLQTVRLLFESQKKLSGINGEYHEILNEGDFDAFTAKLSSIGFQHRTPTVTEIVKSFIEKTLDKSGGDAVN